MSGFAQITRHFDRNDFDILVARRDHDKGAKGFSSKSRLTGAIFAQISGRDSPRPVEKGVKPLQGGRDHLGLPPKPVSRSTLAHADGRGPAETREKHFHVTRGRLSSQTRPGTSKKLRFINPPGMVDSTTIEPRIDTLE
jgi:hypothetical protein